MRDFKVTRSHLSCKHFLQRYVGSLSQVSLFYLIKESYSVHHRKLAATITPSNIVSKQSFAILHRLILWWELTQYIILSRLCLLRLIINDHSWQSLLKAAVYRKKNTKKTWWITFSQQQMLQNDYHLSAKQRPKPTFMLWKTKFPPKHLVFFGAGVFTLQHVRRVWCH